jgi:hypothetical protein
MKIKTIFLPMLATVLVACGTASGGAATAGKITISDAWARPATVAMEHNGHDASTKKDGPNSAAYMLIDNTGDADVLLSVGVSSDVAAVAEIHQTKEENGLMTMNPQPNGVEVPANAQLAFKPGGYHIMLMGVKQTLAPGQRIKLTLKFKNNGDVSLDVPVRENK